MTEDPEVLWQMVLDEFVAGKRSGIRCPFCAKADIAIDETPVRTRLSCPECRRFVEGKLGG